MYPYRYLQEPHPINQNEIFVAMPFDRKLDKVFETLIKRAVTDANSRLDRRESHLLFPYRTKDDPRTINGWEEVLHHLASARLILGVLTCDNPNVYYELGIAHATQPLNRQILIARSDYKSLFDTKDIIFAPYDFDCLAQSVERLAKRIESAIKESEKHDDERIQRSKRQLGPGEFQVVLQYGQRTNFAFNNIVSQSVDISSAIGNLCRLRILALMTAAPADQHGVVEYSYHWTRLGNQILASRDLCIIDQTEAIRRNGSAPD